MALIGGLMFHAGKGGLLLGLLQFVSTFAIAVAYARYAEKNLDPTAAELRARVEEKL